jgi:nucleoside 2-deoxyribosyltransferase
MKVYIAAPYQEREFAQRMMAELQRDGIVCTSQWLTSEDDLTDEHARKDLRDIDRADAVLLINPECYASSGTGGRHVEVGYALARSKPVLLWGSRSNIFHYLNEVTLTPSMADVLGMLNRLETAQC